MHYHFVNIWQFPLQPSVVHVTIMSADIHLIISTWASNQVLLTGLNSYSNLLWHALTNFPSDNRTTADSKKYMQ